MVFKVNNRVLYQDTDSLYIHKKHWNELDKFGLVGSENLLQGKNDYGKYDGGIFYGSFLAPKVKYNLTINEFGIVRRTQNIQRIW